jgi:hypothetical protein
MSADGEIDLAQFGYASDEEAHAALARAIGTDVLPIPRKSRKSWTFSRKQHRDGEFLTINVPWWVIIHAAQAAPAGLCLYLALVRASTMAKSPTCRVPSQWVLDSLRVSPKRMAAALHGLVDAGLLTIVRRDPGGTVVRLLDPPDKPPGTVSALSEHGDDLAGNAVGKVSDCGGEDECWSFETTRRDTLWVLEQASFECSGPSAEDLGKAYGCGVQPSLNRAEIAQVWE